MTNVDHSWWLSNIRTAQWNVHYRRHFKNVWKATERRRQYVGVEGCNLFFSFSLFLNLTFSHSVFTCPSDNCLHSLSCSIHWSISFVNAFSSISVCFGGSPQFICRRVSWFRLGDGSPRCSLVFSGVLQNGHGRCQLLFYEKHVTTSGHQVAMIWLNWNRRGREGETSVGYPPQKFVCVELSAIKYRSSGCDLLNKSTKA